MKRSISMLVVTMLALFMGNSLTSCDDDESAENNNQPNRTDDTILKYYATTDMTWAEFYAGELSKPESAIVSEYDGVTSATSKVLRFSGMLVDSSSCLGVKSVNVAMTETVYKSLKDKSRFTFLKDTVLSEYKQLYKDGNFGPMVTSTSKQSASNITLSSGSDAKFAQYILSLAGLDLEGLKDSTGKLENLIGGIITTSNGEKYGLVPLNNFWLNASEIGFSVSAFTEVHGKACAYEHTSSLEGKTITNVTYMVKNAPDISVDMNVFVKEQTSASMTAEDVKSGNNVKVKLIAKDVPSDANYKLTTVKVGAGKSAKPLESTAYSFENGVLTILGEVAPNKYSFSFTDDKYVNVGATFNVVE